MTPDALRNLLSTFGPLRPQPASNWTGEVPLPPPLALFYAEVGPFGEVLDRGPSPEGLTIPTVGNPFWIPPLSRSWELQAGYRWDARTGGRIADWQEGWIVVAEQGGDPFVLDALGPEPGAVLHARHGTGSWRLRRLFPDMFAMAACLGTAGRLHEEAGEDLLDDDFTVRPAWRTRLVEALLPVLGGKAEATAVADFFEW